MSDERKHRPGSAGGKRSRFGEWLSLSDHMTDVGDCFLALIGLPLFRSQLAAALGRPPDEVTAARLAVLAHLHDLGKLSSTFQARMLDPTIRAGHTTEGWHLLCAEEAIDVARALALPEIGEWGDAARRLFVAATRC